MEILLLIVAIFCIWLYEPLTHRPPHLYLATWLDKDTPLLPLFIIPYIAFFPYVILGFALLFATSVGGAFYVTVIIAQLAGALFWYFLPTGVHRPRTMYPGVMTSAIKFVYGHDGEANAFPSAHVFGSFITSYYLALAFPGLALLWWIIGFCIALSTVFVKQHNLLDVAGGLVWALGALAIVQVLSQLV
jgi:membrane-associated phospholipid phosphatase